MPLLRKIIVLSAASMFLAGCPVPLPSGYDIDSRENLADKAPAFIKEGEVTRGDVMLALGEPDAVAEDESWIAYTSAYKTGGVAFVVAAGGGAGGFGVWGERASRLIVRFDERGIVTHVIFDLEECTRGAVAVDRGGSESEHCLNISGDDIPAIYNLAPKRH